MIKNVIKEILKSKIKLINWVLIQKRLKRPLNLKKLEHIYKFTITINNLKIIKIQNSALAIPNFPFSLWCSGVVLLVLVIIITTTLITLVTVVGAGWHLAFSVFTFCAFLKSVLFSFRLFSSPLVSVFPLFSLFSLFSFWFFPYFG